MQRFFGQLAQLVEQRIENPRVRGSIPRLATRIQKPTVLGWFFFRRYLPDATKFAKCYGLRCLKSANTVSKGIRTDLPSRNFG